MLTREANERLTRVGPGTPMGTLLRRYWHPIAASVELEKQPVKKVRVLGEDLVLYRDRSGNLGLIDEPCPHRRVSMEDGIPEQEGLRCPYHGWLFNHEGRCLEQPAEPWNSTFKDRVFTKAYRAQELGGLVFAYLGPEPAPLLPRYDLLVWDNVVRHIGVSVVPCNWVQCMENSLDPVHVEYLHGKFMEYVWSRRGRTLPADGGVRMRHEKIAFDLFPYGMIKRRVVRGKSEEDDGWTVGHPVIFPNILRVGVGPCNYGFQYRTPIDDTHTYHVAYGVYRPGIPVSPQEFIPYYDIPMRTEDGQPNLEVILVQDYHAWMSQGPIAQRDKEHLGQTDIGVIMYRELLAEQTARVEQGQEPMGLIHDPGENECIALPQETMPYDVRLNSRLTPSYGGARWDGQEAKYSPIMDQVRELFAAADARTETGGLLPYPDSPRHPVGDRHRAVQLLAPG
ncbi:MAG: aromatic ring-hydroxylating dioxygenase subunit alpha [Dehalococcoidia bacterium]|nr:aromatic ring-hydroxylating dioxygenase subunit alpha [Dehalococcoidia bacterium]